LIKEMTMAIPGIKVAGLLRSVLIVAAPLTIAGLLPGAIANAVELKLKPITVTGCLQKGTAENEFVLTTKAGKKYGVVSTAVALAGHVGHTVTIKGSSEGEATAADTAAAHQAGHIDATSLTMVSKTCS
jgi:hypothetical protein